MVGKPVFYIARITIHAPNIICFVLRIHFFAFFQFQPPTSNIWHSNLTYMVSGLKVSITIRFRFHSLMIRKNMYNSQAKHFLLSSHWCFTVKPRFFSQSKVAHNQNRTLVFTVKSWPIKLFSSDKKETLFNKSCGIYPTYIGECQHM